MGENDIRKVAKEKYNIKSAKNYMKQSNEKDLENIIERNIKKKGKNERKKEELYEFYLPKNVFIQT